MKRRIVQVTTSPAGIDSDGFNSYEVFAVADDGSLWARNAIDDGVPFAGNSWEHPVVSAYSDAVKVLQDEKVIR